MLKLLINILILGTYLIKIKTYNNTGKQLLRNKVFEGIQK